MPDILDAKASGARRFEGQVAVITGAGQGIGAATARRLAQEGASVVIGDMVEESSQRVCDELRDFGAEAAVCLGELSRWENAERLMAFAQEQFGHIDVLANVGWRYHLVPVLPVLHARPDQGRIRQELLDRHVVLPRRTALHD